MKQKNLRMVNKEALGLKNEQERRESWHAMNCMEWRQREKNLTHQGQLRFSLIF